MGRRGFSLVAQPQPRDTHPLVQEGREPPRTPTSLQRSDRPQEGPRRDPRDLPTGIGPKPAFVRGAKRASLGTMQNCSPRVPGNSVPRGNSDPEAADGLPCTIRERCFAASADCPLPQRLGVLDQSKAQLPSTYTVDDGMKPVACICTSVAVVAVALTTVLSGSADSAEMAAGPDQSLTVVETPVPSYTFGSTLSTLYAYSGSAQEGFSVPVPISEPGDGPGTPDLAVDRAGDALAVWSASRVYIARSQFGESLQMPRGIWYAWRPAGGSFLPPRQLAAPAPGQGVAMAAMSRTGEMAIAYEERGSIYLRRGRANRDFGPATVITGGTLTPTGPTTRLGYLGFDAAGELLIVSSRTDRIQAQFVAPNGKLGKAQLIGPRLSKHEYLPGDLAVAMNARGAAVIAWASDYVFAAYRKPRSRFGPTQRLTPPIPRDSDARPGLANVVMDERGLAMFGLGTFGGIAGIGLPEMSYWDGKGSPSEHTSLGGWTTTRPGMSLAENEADEAAVAYVGQQGAGVEVRFNSHGQPFGPSQRMTAGPCPGVGLAVTLEHCGVIPAIVGARDGAFFAVTRSSVIGRHSPDGHRRVAEIRSLSRAGVSPPSYVSLPEPPFPEPRSAPASIINIDATTTVDAHGRIHAKVRCGTDEGGCSVRMSVTNGASRRPILGHRTVRLGGFEERPITITLSRRGRRELVRRGSLHVLLLTRTTGTYGPALETTYPLTLLVARRG